MAKRVREKLKEDTGSYFVSEKPNYSFVIEGQRHWYDLKGKKFTRLTVIERAGYRKSFGIMWACKCSCGKKTIVGSGQLRSGDTKSCGCLAVERSKERSTKHGCYYHPSYKTWIGMMARCYNKKEKAYKYYGARGIMVVQKWHDVRNFINDMGVKPKGLTIERKDNNKHYCKSNCVWATMKTQARNSRHTQLTVPKAAKIRKLRAAGISYTTIAQQFGVKYSVVYDVCRQRTWA